MIFDKPHIQEDDIRDILLLFFDGAPIAPKITDLGGIPNNNFRVQTDSIDVVIKIYSKGQSTVEHIEKEVLFTVFMEQHGVSTLEFVNGRNGQYLQYWNGYPVVCSHYIPGRLLSEIVIDRDLAIKVGAYIASFEETAAKCDVNVLAPVNLSSLVEYVFQDINRQVLSHTQTNDLDCVLLHWRKIDPEIEKLGSRYPPQCVHMDLWPYNLIIQHDVLHSIDYDDWLFTVPIFELAVALLEFCMFQCAIFDWEKAYAILEGYCSLSNKHYHSQDLQLALQYLCVLWYGYNLVESDDYNDAEIYRKKLDLLLTGSFAAEFKTLSTHFFGPAD